MTMKSVLAIQHTPAETIGSIAAPLAAANVAVHTCEVFCQQIVPTEIGNYSGLILMGGPMSVYEQDRYPFIESDLALIQSAMTAGKPVLGICLGSQLIAAALGARVYPGRKKEIGWLKVRLHEGGMRDPLFVGVPFAFTAFHWHGDVFSLPLGAVPLASSALTEQQAFRYGAKAYGLLFHLEVARPHIDGRVETFRQELEEAGIDAETIVQQTSEYLPSLQAVGTLVFEHWTRMLACD